MKTRRKLSLINKFYFIIKLFIYFCFSSLSSQEVLLGGRFYVHHPNGIPIYLLSSLDSEQIGTLSYGSRVELTKELASTKTEVDGIQAFWREIQTKKHHGYVLDAYLSRYPVPTTNCESLQTYMDELYRKQKISYRDEKEFRAIVTLYQGGNEHVFAKLENKRIQKILLKNAKLKDGFFIGRACSHPAFRGISYKPKNNKLEFYIEGLKNSSWFQLEIQETKEGTNITYTEIQNEGADK